MPLNIVIIYGSVRRDRQGIRAARFAEVSLKARGHAVSFVDALEVQLPLLDRMYKDTRGVRRRKCSRGWPPCTGQQTRS